jgi:hypothetical protein
MSSVVELKSRRPKKRRKSTPRDLALDKSSGAARFFQRMIRDIENDLGGRQRLTRIEGELIRAFAGAATTLQYLNLQIAIGELSEVDLTGYASMASTMVRIGSRLGLSRRQVEQGQSLSKFIESGNWTGAEDSDSNRVEECDSIGAEAAEGP